jgi:hypothetical protein
VKRIRFRDAAAIGASFLPPDDNMSDAPGYISGPEINRLPAGTAGPALSGRTLVQVLPPGAYDLLYKIGGSVELWKWDEDLKRFETGAVDIGGLSTSGTRPPTSPGMSDEDYAARRGEAASRSMSQGTRDGIRAAREVRSNLSVIQRLQAKYDAFYGRTPR